MLHLSSPAWFADQHEQRVIFSEPQRPPSPSRVITIDDDEETDDTEMQESLLQSLPQRPQHNDERDDLQTAMQLSKEEADKKSEWEQKEDEEIRRATQLSLEQDERERRQRVREEQDRAYQESLLRDQEKQRQQEQKARDEQLRVNQEAEERRRKEHAEYDSELQAALEYSNQLAEKTTSQNRLRQIKLPPVPTSADNSLQISIRLPQGDKLERTFSLSDTIGVVRDFIDIHVLEENGAFLIPTDYSLVTDFPRQVWHDRTTRLVATPFRKRQLFRVEENL